MTLGLFLPAVKSTTSAAAPAIIAPTLTFSAMTMSPLISAIQAKLSKTAVCQSPALNAATAFITIPVKMCSTPTPQAMSSTGNMPSSSEKPISGGNHSAPK